jgi:hypothetical protein
MFWSVRGKLHRREDVINHVLLVPALLILALGVLSSCGGGDEAILEPTFTPYLTDTPVVPTKTAPKTAMPATPSEDAGNSTFGVHVNTAKRHSISPWIYGVADSTPGDEDLLRWLGVTLVRWGGNARSRHNWEINASNAGADYEFRNVSQGDNRPGSASLLFMQRDERLGAASILTIPTIGWVAKDGNESSQSVGVPEHGGPAIEKGSDTAFTEFKDDVWTKPYDPSANRARTSVQSFPSKGAPFSYPPDLNDGKVYQDEWVAYLKGNRPQEGAPPIYAMDNESDLWADSAHVDVHPVRQGYDDMLSNFLTYARAVKQTDPTALIAGPESWGVTGYLFSALDEGGDKFATAADRKAHGDAPWLQWFLGSAHNSDKATGQRSLDILTVHYYPTAGQYEGGNAPDMQAKRVQAPRALWDGLYVEPSWVANTEWASLGLLRRLNALIGQFYPDTRLGLTEWNFGGENDISGAIATADALGIFGRENLYCASYWGLPKQGSATSWAFRLYRNYDGKGAAFGSESVETTVSDVKTYSAYGALNKEGTKLTLMLINKDPSKSADMPIDIKGFTPSNNATLYRYSQQKPSDIAQEPFNIPNPAAIKLTLPPMSNSLLVMDQAQK